MKKVISACELRVSPKPFYPLPCEVAAVCAYRHIHCIRYVQDTCINYVPVS